MRPLPLLGHETCSRRKRLLVGPTSARSSRSASHSCNSTERIILVQPIERSRSGSLLVVEVRTRRLLPVSSNGSLILCWSPCVSFRGDFEARLSEDINYGGDSAGIWPETGQHDLTEFDNGLGPFDGDWNDKISSVGIRGRCWFRGWEDADWGCDSLILYEDTPDLGRLGWNDRISSLWCYFRS